MGRANKSGKNFRRFWPALLLPQKAIKKMAAKPIPANPVT
jgi:hypothetical protein